MVVVWESSLDLRLKMTPKYNEKARVLFYNFGVWQIDKPARLVSLLVSLKADENVLAYPCQKVENCQTGPYQSQDCLLKKFYKTTILSEETTPTYRPST